MTSMVSQKNTHVKERRTRKRLWHHSVIN